eukprot:COSAG01_NODE_18481_length_1073_cov_1.201232_2_plen_72_part_00
MTTEEQPIWGFLKEQRTILDVASTRGKSSDSPITLRALRDCVLMPLATYTRRLGLSAGLIVVGGGGGVWGG